MKFPATEWNMGVNCDQGAHSDVRVVVVHETQGSTIEGGISTLKSRSDGSAHEITGPDSRGKLRRVRLAQDNRILCHCGGQNSYTYGMEKVGISAWKKAFRLASKTERANIALAAYATAHALRRHDLPPRYLSIKTLSKGNVAADFRGWTYHRNCAYAFRTTTHTDPGVPGISWPHKRFKQLVRFYYLFPSVKETVSMREVRRKLREAKKRHP